MSSHTTHPLVDSYLRDLELLLHGIDPGERAEVLAGVREHLDGSLAPGADAAAVRAVLVELGPPQAIADEAYAGRPAPVASRTTPARWQAVTACGLNALGLLLIGFAALFAMGPALVVMTGFTFALPWVAIVVLSVLDRSWSTRQRVTSIALFPGTMIAVSVLVLLLLALVGPAFYNLIPTVAVVALGFVVLVQLTRTALRGGLIQSGQQPERLAAQHH